MTEEQKYQVESEEIDLVDYARVLIKRKWAILSMVLITVIAAGIFSFLSPKVYKTETVLEVGQFNGSIIEDPAQVVEKIRGDSYGVLVRKNLNIPEQEYPKEDVDNPEGTQLLKITINSSNTQQAKSILEEIITLIIEEHNKKIETNTVLIAENIKTVEEKIKLVESDIEKTENKIKITESDIDKTKNKIKPLESDIERVKNKIEYAGEEKENLEAKVEALEKVLVYEQTPGTQFALFDTKEKLANKKQEIEDLYSRINSLKIEIENLNLTINSLERTKNDYNSQINSLKTNIESFNSEINSLRASLNDIRPTQAIKEPTISAEPVSPRLLLNMAIAGVLGLFFGLFFAFFLEWYSKNKSRF